MAVITISRQFGSGGDEIVERICENTGYLLFNKSILTRAAVESGLSDQEVVDYSEENYRVKNFFSRLFGSSRSVTQVRVWKEDKEGVRFTEQIILSEEHALALARKAVETAYQMGSIVIVGRGGQSILKDKPGVLHVRIVAQLEDRILRVRNEPGFIDRAFDDVLQARRAARDLIEASDAASADYLKRFYGVDWSDPMLYHLLVNTSLVDIKLAAEIIIAAALRLEHKIELAE